MKDQQCESSGAVYAFLPNRESVVCPGCLTLIATATCTLMGERAGVVHRDALGYGHRAKAEDRTWHGQSEVLLRMPDHLGEHNEHDAQREGYRNSAVGHGTPDRCMEADWQEWEMGEVR